MSESNQVPAGKPFKFDESKPISPDNPFDTGAYFDSIQAQKVDDLLHEQEADDAEPQALTLEEKYEAAYFESTSRECGLNGDAINWRYWVHQMPSLSAAQAACLMSALEPDLFANLSGRPGEDDPAPNIEKARKIQRLAEAQGKLTASPVEWIEWAREHRISVHTGFLLAVWELPEATSADGDATAEPDMSGDEAEPKQLEQVDTDALAALFNPVTPAALEKMFPASGGWARWHKKAKEKGLDVARVGMGTYNPYLAALWWLKKQAPDGWTLGQCLKRLANNLPPRSHGLEYRLTGKSEWENHYCPEISVNRFNWVDISAPS